MKRFLVSAAIIVSSNAWATQPENPGNGNGNQVHSENSSSASASASAASHAAAIGVGIGQGGVGGTGLGGEGGAGGIGGAGGVSSASQSYNVEAIRQSPSVFMNAPAPTAPCQATAGGFVSFIAGGGFAASYTLEQCEIRETARIAHGIGEQAMARKILCKAEFAKDLEECRI